MMTDSELTSDDEDWEEDEQLIIQLMDSMFTRKKTVEESIQMINEVDLDKLREEFREIRLKKISMKAADERAR